MLKNCLLIGSLLFAGFASAQDGWLRVRVSTPSPFAVQRLQSTGLDVMDCIPTIGTNDVILAPGQMPDLIAAGFEFSIVGQVEDPTNWQERHEFVPQADYRLNYLTADQILGFYEGMRAQYPDFVTRKSIGTTINGETIWAYRFGQARKKGLAGGVDPSKNIIVLGLIHAREWISGSVVMHLARKTLDGMIANRAFMYNQALWIVPIHNPDGYRYTWSTDRLWRKNRRNNGGGSFGVDLNRNYSKGWGLNGGSSGTKSSETYRGTAAFSEPETQAVRNFAASLPNVVGMIDYHSYSQIILWPWGYQTSAPTDASQFNTIGADMRAAMSSLGANYVQGETSNILYIASGISNDFIYDQYHALAMGVELRDTGAFGFVLPENQITPTQDEAWLGFQRYLSYMPH